MKVYAAVGLTAPFYWASRSDIKILGYYKTREGAERKITKMKESNLWYMDWEEFGIDAITIED